MARRSFSVPAGTDANGFLVPESLDVTLTYSPSEMTPGQAQKAAIREATARLQQRYPNIRITPAALQRATKARHAELHPKKVRGGRTPARLKVAGGFTDVGEKKGVRIYRKGSERSKGGAVSFEDMQAMVAAAFARHPGAILSVAAFGWGREQDNQSPKRRKKNSPIGAYKAGDIIPKARQWGSTAGVASMAAWHDAGLDVDELWSAETQLDAHRLSRVDILVRQPEAGE